MKNGLGYCFSLKVKCGYISAHKLKSERSKSFAVSISCKTRPSGLSLASMGLENIPQVLGNPFEVRQNYDIRKAVSATLSVLK